MKKWGIIVGLLLACCLPLAALATAEEATPSQIEALQAQIQAIQDQYQKQIDFLQSQVDELKKQSLQQNIDKESLLKQMTQTAKAASGTPFLRFAGPYRLRKDEALEEEGKLNISGEIAIQFKEPMKQRTSHTSNIGFRIYELPELFLDSNLTENISFFAEVPLAYEGGGPTLEDGWIDFHFADQLAARGDTGVKLGQFHAPFGWDNDDNESLVYGGRTGVDSSIVRSQRLDGQRMRERVIGVVGTHALDVAELLKLNTKNPLKLYTAVGIFNGAGPTGNSVEWDNDDAKDVVSRLEAHFLNTVIGGSFWHSPRTKNITADVNNTRHTRNIRRYGIHFKYPEDVPFPAEDISLGGKRWLFWGEWIWSEASHSQVGSEADTRARGGYLEFDYGFTPKLVGYFRGETYDPARGTSGDGMNAYILGIKWEFWKVCQLTFDYERDNFKGTNPTDRIGGMFKIFF